MRPGPSRKPTALKILEGNPGRKPLNDAEPKPQVGMPDRPKEIKGDALKCWNHVGPLLVELGVMTVGDGYAFARFCFSWVDVRNAQKAVDDLDCKIVEGANGTTYQHPALKILADTDRRFQYWADQFGLTPAARSRLRVEPKKDRDLGLSELMQNRDVG